MRGVFISSSDLKILNLQLESQTNRQSDDVPEVTRCNKERVHSYAKCNLLHSPPLDICLVSLLQQEQQLLWRGSFPSGNFWGLFIHLLSQEVVYGYSMCVCEQHWVVVSDLGVQMAGRLSSWVLILYVTFLVFVGNRY